MMIGYPWSSLFAEMFFGFAPSSNIRKYTEDSITNLISLQWKTKMVVSHYANMPMHYADIFKCCKYDYF